MSLIHVISGQLLVVTEKFSGMIENLINLDIQKKDVSYGYDDEDSNHEFSVTPEGVAIIDIKGSLSKNVSWWGHYFGRATSYAWIKEQVQTAIDLDEVKTVLLSFDSPGGDVDGVKESSDFIYNAAQIKPFYTYADGCMCSGAYWLGSIGKTIAAPATADIGSIGVRTVHVDRDEMNKKKGMKITHLAAGEYKALGNGDEPLNGSAKDYILSQLNQVYHIFMDDVTRNRNIDKSETKKMAEGKVFIGEEALSIGLIDIVTESKETFIDYIIETENLRQMDLDEFKTKHGDLFSQIVADTKTGLKADTKTLINEAITAETGRILDISSAVIGEELSGKLSSVVKSGANASQVNALKDVLGVVSEKPAETEKDTKQAILDNLKSVHSGGINPKKDDQEVNDIDSQADALVNLIQ
jgi:signal peptide peptidase SppA